MIHAKEKNAMETERLSFIPLSSEYAAMLLRDPQQLEEALCVAYSGPEIEGHWAGVLRQIVSQPKPPATPVSQDSPQKIIAWLVRMRAEETIIGTFQAIRLAGQTIWQFRYDISPAYQHLGYKGEINAMMARTISLE